jgi:hypothetical protein
VDHVVDLHVVFEEGANLRGALGAGLPLDAGVDVLGVFAEGDHIHRTRIFNRRGNAVEMVGRADVGVKIKLLAERDVQRAKPRADRRRQRALDRDAVFADGVDGLLWEVLVVHLAGGAAGVDPHPRERVAGCFGGGVEYLLCGRADIRADPVAVNDRNDRCFWDVQFPGVLVGECDLLAGLGNLNLVVAHRR